jgi:5S rRNA maturation endonuclease (ribonuclease M5)
MCGARCKKCAAMERNSRIWQLRRLNFGLRRTGFGALDTDREISRLHAVHLMTLKEILALTDPDTRIEQLRAKLAQELKTPA